MFIEIFLIIYTNNDWHSFYVPVGYSILIKDVYITYRFEYVSEIVIKNDEKGEE